MKLGILFTMFVAIMFLSSTVMAPDHLPGQRKNADKIEQMKNLRQDEQEKFKDLREEQKERINTLKEESFNRVKELRKEQIDKLKDVNKEGLKRISDLEKSKLEKITNLEKTDVEKLSLLGRQRIKNLSDLDSEILKMRLKNITVEKVDKGRMLVKRTIAETELSDAKDRIEKIRQDIGDRKSRIQEHREQLMEIRDQFKSCEDTNSTECDAIKSSALERARNLVLRNIDLAIDHLNKIKSHIESNDNIEESDATSAISDIDAAIEELNDIKTRVTSAATTSELRDLAKEAKDAWKGIEHRARIHSAKVVLSEVGEILSRAQHLERKLDRIMSFADEKGMDVSDLEGSVSEFSSKIESARSKIDESKSKFEQAKDLRESARADGNITDAESEEIKSNLDDARMLAREAHQMLKDAHQLLKAIADQIHERIEVNTEVEIETEQITNVEADLTAEIGEPEAVEVTG